MWGMRGGSAGSWACSSCCAWDGRHSLVGGKGRWIVCFRWAHRARGCHRAAVPGRQAGRRAGRRAGGQCSRHGSHANDGNAWQIGGKPVDSAKCQGGALRGQLGRSGVSVRLFAVAMRGAPLSAAGVAPLQSRVPECCRRGAGRAPPPLKACCASAAAELWDGRQGAPTAAAAAGQRAPAQSCQPSACPPVDGPQRAGWTGRRRGYQPKQAVNSVPSFGGVGNVQEGRQGSGRRPLATLGGRGRRPQGVVRAWRRK